MQTRKDKILFLRGLQSGHRKLEEILPMRFVDLHNRNGIITDETGRTYSELEVEELEKQPNTFFTLHLWSDIPLASCEEDINLSPYYHK